MMFIYMEAGNAYTKKLHYVDSVYKLRFSNWWVCKMVTEIAMEVYYLVGSGSYWTLELSESKQSELLEALSHHIPSRAIKP